MAKKHASRCLRAVVAVWVTLAMVLAAGPVPAFGLSGADEQMGEETVKEDSSASSSSPDAPAGTNAAPVSQVVENGDMGVEGQPNSVDQSANQTVDQPDAATNVELSTSSEQPASADGEMGESSDERAGENGEGAALLPEADKRESATIYRIWETVNNYFYQNGPKEHIYKFWVSNAGRIRLKSTFGISRVYFTLYDENYKEVWKTNEFWNSDTEQGSVNELVDLTRGVYYLSVEPNFYTPNTGPYSFTLTYASAKVSFEESQGGSNNSLNQSQKISLGTTYRGQFAENDKKDVYRFWVPSTSRIRLTSNFAYFSRLYFKVYDENGNEIWKWNEFWNSNIEKGSIVQDVNLSGGVYYLSVEPSFYSPSTGNYNLTIGNGFPDVAYDHWASTVISRAAARGLMSGYSSGYFGPGDRITRAQVATILWNMAGRPGVGYGAKSFPDVKSGTYYYTAVRWASSKGVVSGYGNGTFGPTRNVTREELAVMLANYAKNVRKGSVSGSINDFSNMSDCWSVAGYARPSVGWCFRTKILSGSNGRVLPKGNATRAEAAKMVVMLKDLVG